MPIKSLYFIRVCMTLRNTKQDTLKNVEVQKTLEPIGFHCMDTFCGQSRADPPYTQNTQAA